MDIMGLVTGKMTLDFEKAKNKIKQYSAFQC
jgi:hypothetical protein